MKIWTAWFSELAFCLQQVKNTLWNKILHRVSLKGQAVFLFPLNATSESHNGHCSAGTAPMAHLMARVTKSRQEWFEYDFIPKEMKVWKECPGRREESVLQWNVWTEALLQGAQTLKLQLLQVTEDFLWGGALLQTLGTHYRRYRHYNNLQERLKQMKLLPVSLCEARTECISSRACLETGNANTCSKAGKRHLRNGSLSHLMFFTQLCWLLNSMFFFTGLKDSVASPKLVWKVSERV